MHGCWEERGCWNEQRAVVDPGHCCCPRAFGCRLMGLFGMPLLLDAEWWSGKCVLLCPSPSVEVKGRSLSWYCSKIKWLEWDGGGTKSTPEQVICLPKEAKAGPRVPWKVLSFAGLDGKDSGSLEFGVIFSYLRMQWLILNSCLSVYYQCLNQCCSEMSFSEQRTRRKCWCKHLLLN